MSKGSTKGTSSGRAAPDPFTWAEDAWAWYRDTYGQALADLWARLAPDQAAAAPRRGGHACCDPCACCVPEADVVVRARPGEHRVVPVTLVNTWRRERTVTVALGSWTLCDGDAAATVEGSVRPDGEITLAPCEERRVLVAIRVGAGGADNRDVKHPEELRTCATWTADLDVGGCGRARIAVVVLPWSCDPLVVTCECGCCGGC